MTQLNPSNLNIPEVTFRHSDAKAELEIIDLSSIQQRSETLSPAPNTAHRIAFNMVILIEQGQGEHLIDSQRVPFGPDSVLFLSAGQIQAFDFATKLVGKAVLYTQEFTHALHANTRIPFLLSASLPNTFAPNIRLTGTFKRSVIRLLDELDIEMNRQQADPAIAMSLFAALLMLLGRERKNPARNLGQVDAQKFMKFLTLIEQRYQYSRDAQFYANELGMSYKTLNLLCKKASDKTAKYHIDQYVILEAKRRLIIEQSSISTLAYDLGFEEPSNFTKFFKRHVGVLPKDFT